MGSAARRTVAALLVLAAASAAPRARADGGPRRPTATELAAARALFARAQEDEDQGRWADALDKVSRASAVKTTPGLLFHVALCEEKLGRLVAALADYTAAEGLARAEGNREVLDLVGEPLGELRARVPTLTVNVVGSATDVEVTVDGAALAADKWGTAVPVETGTHIIAARAPGRAPYARRMTVAEREAAGIDVNLLRVAPPATAAPASGSSPSEVGARGGDTATAGEEEPRAASRRRAAAIAATAGAVVLAGAGVAAYLVADGRQGDGQTACAARVSCDDLRGPVRAWDALALAGWIGAGAAGALAIVLWATPPRGTAEPRASSRLGLAPGGVRLDGTF